MRILADMPISPKTVEYLKKLGFECHHLTEFKMENSTDEDITNFAKENNYTILTEDLDFGTILAYTKEIEPSVIILRIGNLNTEEINELLERTMRKIKDIRNSIIIIERTRIRIRSLPVEKRQ